MNPWDRQNLDNSRALAGTAFGLGGDIAMKRWDPNQLSGIGTGEDARNRAEQADSRSADAAHDVARRPGHGPGNDGEQERVGDGDP